MWIQSMYTDCNVSSSWLWLINVLNYDKLWIIPFDVMRYPNSHMHQIPIDSGESILVRVSLAQS